MLMIQVKSSSILTLRKQKRLDKSNLVKVKP
ncbi:hypothetical protein HID58_013589 [Brassica napus]|uniref:Uncharacterized protein n=1 Tax=Brassica napus TaxID=3708 RepID=A0ABQ8E4Z4_BRANA|nr:hypothetical protein HID58_013589 [Brassica napus]